MAHHCTCTFSVQTHLKLKGLGFHLRLVPLHNTKKVDGHQMSQRPQPNGFNMF